MRTKFRYLALIAIGITSLSKPVWSQTTLSRPGLTTAPTGTPTAVNPLIGRWSSSSIDKESGITETLLIEFKSDGTYETRIDNGPLGATQPLGRGNYAAGDFDKSGFTLKLKRQLDDPETDRSLAADSDRIRIVDSQTLQASDGSTIRRVK